MVLSPLSESRLNLFKGKIRVLNSELQKMQIHILRMQSIDGASSDSVKAELALSIALTESKVIIMITIALHSWIALHAWSRTSQS